MVQDFMKNILHQMIKIKYIDDDMRGVFPKQKVRKLHNTKYQKTYSNQYYVLKMTIYIIQEYVRHIKEEN